MDGKTLMAAMSYPGYDAPLTLSRYTELVAPCAKALVEANCTTVRRAAVFLAQIGAESGSLRWTEELADGSAYEWRTDLGNTHKGDGPRFKGRSFIQITGRTNYTLLSAWAHNKGYVPSSDYFVQNPGNLAHDKYAFLGPVWYWTVARPQLNDLADAGDIKGATLAVNGGYNNLSGRTARYHKCLSLGNALLPPKPKPKDWFDMATQADLQKAVIAALESPAGQAAIWAQIQRPLHPTQPDGTPSASPASIAAIVHAELKAMGLGK